MHLYFMEHLGDAGQIILFFHSCCRQHINLTQNQICLFFLYQMLAVCPALITLRSPVHKLNASGKKIGIK